MTSRSGAFRKFSYGIASSSIARKHNYTVRRLETVGIGLVLAGSCPFMKIIVAVFNGRNFDVRVLVNDPSANIVAKEHLGYR